MTPEESFALATQQDPTPGEQAAAGEVQPTEPAPPAPSAAEPAEQAPVERKLNPIWDEAWADVPDPIRQQQRTVFEKWDANYNGLQARYAPYQKFEQQGYNPQYLETAIDIQRALVTDPEGFVRQAIQEFGLTAFQAQQLQAAAQGQEEEFLDPQEQRLRQLEALEAERQQQWEQQQQQYAAEQARQQGAQQVQAAIANLHQKYGDFDEERLVIWATGNAQAGRNPDLEVNLNEMLAWEAEVAQRAVRTAPRVNGTSTSVAPIPAPTEPKKVASPDELLARAMQLGQQLAQGQ